MSLIKERVRTRGGILPPTPPVPRKSERIC